MFPCSTQRGEGRIGCELPEAVPDWWGAGAVPAPLPGLGRGPGRSLRRAELGARRASAAQVSFTRWRDVAGGLGWARGCRRPPSQPGAPPSFGVGNQRLHCRDGVSSRTPNPCTPLDSPRPGGHRLGVSISEPYPDTSPELAAS